MIPSRTIAASLLAASLLGAQVPCPAPAIARVCGALVPGTPLPYPNGAAPAQLDLGGAPVVDVRIIGHSENRGYHRFLQPMLDAAPPLPGVQFRVTNHWISGHEAWRWATPGQRGFDTITSILQQTQGAPLIVLGLLSNNNSFPIGAPTIGDPNYRRFAQDLRSIADRLHDGGNGAQMVYFSAHRYKPSNFLPSYYENCAVGRLMLLAQRDGAAHLKPGPEQHGLHWCCFPTCYAPDLSHTNQQGDQLMAQTWYAFLVRELTGCASVPFGAGSAGAGGQTPILAPAGGFPALGNGQFALSSRDLRSAAQIAYLFGAAPLTGPIWARPDVVLGAMAAAAGTHDLPLPIPTQPVLHGGVVYTQVLALDPAAALGVAMSQGLRLELCR